MRDPSAWPFFYVNDQCIVNPRRKTKREWNLPSTHPTFDCPAEITLRRAGKYFHTSLSKQWRTVDVMWIRFSLFACVLMHLDDPFSVIFQSSEVQRVLRQRQDLWSLMVGQLSAYGKQIPKTERNFLKWGNKRPELWLVQDLEMRVAANKSNTFAKKNLLKFSFHFRLFPSEKSHRREAANKGKQLRVITFRQIRWLSFEEAEKLPRSFRPEENQKTFTNLKTREIAGNMCFLSFFSFQIIGTRGLQPVREKGWMRFGHTKNYLKFQKENNLEKMKKKSLKGPDKRFLFSYGIQLACTNAQWFIPRLGVRRRSRWRDFWRQLVSLSNEEDFFARKQPKDDIRI